MADIGWDQTRYNAWILQVSVVLWFKSKYLGVTQSFLFVFVQSDFRRKWKAFPAHKTKSKREPLSRMFSDVNANVSFLAKQFFYVYITLKSLFE